MKIVSELNKFVESRYKNLWISGNGIRVYLRKSFRKVNDGDIVETLDLANVQVGDGKRQRTGRLKPVFQAMEAQKLYSYIYVENCNKRMQEICMKNGYSKIHQNVDLLWVFNPSFIKKIA